jgi:hypothetical protein
MRIQYLDTFYKPYIEVTEESGVDAFSFLSTPRYNVMTVKNIGQIKFNQPVPGSENIFQTAEQSNIERTRFYASQPANIDGSSDKTHQTGQAAKMEAAQMPFNVLLGIVRENLNKLYRQMHELNLAYLTGDVEVEASGELDDPSTYCTTLTEDHLDILRENRNSIQLFVGTALGADKAEQLAQVLNNPLIAKQLEGVSPKTNAIMAGKLFGYMGIDEFDQLIKSDLKATEEAQAEQMAAAPMEEMTVDPKTGQPIEMPLSPDAGMMPPAPQGMTPPQAPPQGQPSQGMIPPQQ